MLVAPRGGDGASEPADGVAVYPRSRAISLLDGAWQTALVVAPPGYGKTATVRTWARRTPLPVFCHDLSSDQDHRAWLADFSARRRDDAAAVLALDHADEVEDPAFWIDLGALVEQSGERLRTIVVARSAAAVPAGRWRAAEALLDIGAANLDHRPDAEMAVASATLDNILRGIEPHHRRNARRLAVPESFDSDLAATIAGPGAGDTVILLARHGLLERTGGTPDRRRFDPAVRHLLIEELVGEDPAEYRRLQFETAGHLALHGDLPSAYRTLDEAGEPDAEAWIVVQPVLKRARAGDDAGVERALAALPAPETVDAPQLAVAVASTCLLCGRVGLAEPWVDRLDELDVAGVPGDELALRVRLVRAQLRLFQGDVDSAGREVAGLDASPQRSTLENIAIAGIGTRVALAERRPVRARQLLAAAPGGTTHQRLEREALTAWCDLLDGNVAAAADRVETALADAERRLHRPSQALLDATITAAWAAYLGGDVTAANRHAVIALADGDHIRCDWNLLRAGGVAVTTLLHLSGPAAARSLLIETRLRRRGGPSALDAVLDTAEVAILRTLGRFDAARAVLDGLADTPHRRLMQASLELTESGALTTAGLLDGRGEWAAPERIVASLLTTLGDQRALAAVVREARRSGLVMPLTGHGPTVDAALTALPLERLHPRLAQHLHAPLASAPTSPLPGATLTARERTVLALLPSHLTYDQIADRLSLSVNTVKSNLKSIYRKLSVASRSDAVDAARAARLV